MNFIILSVVLSVYVSCTTSKALPKYIEKCSVSNFDACFVKNGNLAIPNLINGDNDLKLPSFNPLLLNEVVFSSGNTLKIVFTNFKISGLNETKITDAHYDESAQIISFTLEMPKLFIESNYNAEGKILILPIEGNGPSQIQLVNPKFIIETKFDNFNAEATKKIKVKEINVEYKVDKSIYNLENLFNGNKQLGDELNKFLNDNHAELKSDFAPIFENVIQEIVKNLMQQTLGHLHYKDVILS